MSEQRSIAEIIGWERVWIDNTYKGQDLGSYWRWVRPEGGFDDPNVDDILAWIIDNGRFEHVHVEHGGDITVSIRVGERNDLYRIERPTLLEALEQAARKIDEEEHR